MEYYLIVTNAFDQLEGEIRTVESFKDYEEAEEVFNQKIKEFDEDELEESQIQYEGAAEIIDSVHPSDSDEIISIDLIKIYL